MLSKLKRAADARPFPRALPALATAALILTIGPRAGAQDMAQMHHGHQGHDAAAAAKQKPAKKPRPAAKRVGDHSAHGATAVGGTHAGHAGGHAGSGGTHGEHAEHGGMVGFLGPYPMTREGSGTSWVPDTSPHEGIHASYGDWQLMGHALFNGVYDNQGGPRGGEKTFISGMAMGMAQRQLGDGTLGFRAMLSPDPFMGKSGYPLLLATGETANGIKPLVDRQHPHDLFMELATTYSHRVSDKSSVFLYAGLPGEPALGPPAFMHRTSGLDIPEAPITHHWLDSTHITFGVLTAGAIVDRWKIEASAFKGREPNEHRFDIENPKLDSYSARLSWNPLDQLSMQVSYGRLKSPEKLAPEMNEDRLTASAIWTQPFGDNNLWSTTAAWGRKMNRPGNTLDGFLVESAVVLDKRLTFFGRAERVANDELSLDEQHEHDVPHGADRVFKVGKLSLGAIYDFRVAEHVRLGVGGLVSKAFVPADLRPSYGGNPTSFMLFVRMKLS
jgi:hypothetical protein